MRRLLLIVALVGSLPGEAAEPQAFEPVPFRLDVQSVGPSAEGGSLLFGSELLFSIRPVPARSGPPPQQFRRPLVPEEYWTAMKPHPLLVAIVASLPADAAKPQPFEPAPLQLDFQRAEPPAEGGSFRFGGELLFSMPFTIGSGVSRGPIRVDYGIPSGLTTPWTPGLLDAPGSGYRKQRAKAVRENPTA